METAEAVIVVFGVLYYHHNKLWCSFNSRYIRDFQVRIVEPAPCFNMVVKSIQKKRLLPLQRLLTWETAEAVIVVFGVLYYHHNELWCWFNSSYIRDFQVRIVEPAPCFNMVVNSMQKTFVAASAAFAV
ncbi:hypothetical protein GF337_05175 [candidate division KSB1 bacterium]|nr:hypothetical protein [candidate division KSB1 bacterium]